MSNKNYIYSPARNKYLAPMYGADARLILSNDCYPFTISDVRNGVVQIYDLNNNRYMVGNCNQTYSGTTLTSGICTDVKGVQENPIVGGPLLPPIMTQHIPNSCYNNL
jgi:hypothetical protein